MDVKIISSPNNKSVFKKLCNIASNFKEGVHEAYIVIGRDLIRTNQKDFRAPKGGRIYNYRLNGRTIRHRASAPGEPPALLTGKLEKSLSAKTSGFTSLTYSAGNEDVIYAGFLEYGTSKMAPRPYLIKSIRDNQGNIIDNFYNHIGRRLK